MARRDNNKDLFHSLSNTHCKNTPVIPALRLLAQIKLENPFQKIEYLCSDYLYQLSELFALILLVINFTPPQNRDVKVYYCIKQHIKAQPHVTAQECLYFLGTGQIFLFQK